MENLSPGQWEVIKIIVARLDTRNIAWAFTGGTSFALQGMLVKPSDIDIQTDKAGAYRLEELLSEYILEPVSFSRADNIRSHFGRLIINNTTVEIIGDIEKELPDGTWTSPPDLLNLCHYIKINDMLIPVLDLDYEALAYKQLGREDRAMQIQQFAKNRGMR